MKQLRLSGSGGQGVITAAIIFAEAAIAEGKEIFIMRKAGELPAFEFEQSAVAFEELRGVDVARFSQA